MELSKVYEKQTLLVATICLLPAFAFIGSDAPWQFSFVIYLCLWVLSVWDWLTFRLPNLYTATFFLAGMLYIYMTTPAYYDHHVIGAVAGLLFFPILNAVYRMVRGRDGVGMGDAKLLAGIGLWLGWEKLPAVLFIASVCGLVYAFGVLFMKDDKNAASKLSFGPFLSLGCWISWLYL